MEVAGARARLDDGTDSAEPLAALESELRRVQGWAASFGFTELKQQSGRLAARVRRWIDDPDLDRGERGAIVGGEVGRLAVLATQPPTRALLRAAPRPAPAAVPVPPPAALPAPPPAPEPAPVEAPRVEVPDVEVPDVVVVQDDPRMARLLLFALEQAGLRVTTIDNGADALDALRRMPATAERPLVILDVELPGLDGHDVHETLRAERPGMFSFVFTAGPSSDGEWMRAVKAGALDYLMRPITLRVLMAKIRQWLDPSAARSAPVVERRPPVILGRRRAGAA
jgi:CheY-like chemotaxis protein